MWCGGRREVREDTESQIGLRRCVTVTVGLAGRMMRFLADHLPAAALLVVPNSISVPASSLHSAPTVVLGFLSSCRRAEKMHGECRFIWC